LEISLNISLLSCGAPIAIESTALNLKIPLFGRSKKVLKDDERLTVDEYHTAQINGRMSVAAGVLSKSITAG
jgi:hypothetical protein